ncbi:MAG TPA: hypothetical protein VMR34_03515 [Candidatus Saccharimonadales bacterium]|nr:hypothetical protein [Candidatus Saccharimonadales bacterium]
MREEVRKEIVPRYLALRLAMGDGSVAIAVRNVGGSNPPIVGLRSAAGMFSPRTSTRVFDPEATGYADETRLRSDARKVLGIPERETDENVDLLLGKAALTLEELSMGAEIDHADLDFTDKFVQGMRNYAAAQPSPSELVGYRLPSSNLF